MLSDAQRCSAMLSNAQRLRPPAPSLTAFAPPGGRGTPPLWHHRRVGPPAEPPPHSRHPSLPRALGHVRAQTGLGGGARRATGQRGNSLREQLTNKRAAGASCPIPKDSVDTRATEIAKGRQSRVSQYHCREYTALQRGQLAVIVRGWRWRQERSGASVMGFSSVPALVSDPVFLRAKGSSHCAGGRGQTGCTSEIEIGQLKRVRLAPTGWTSGARM